MAKKEIEEDDEVEEKKPPKVRAKPVKIVQEEEESDKDKFLSDDEFEDGDIAEENED